MVKSKFWKQQLKHLPQMSNIPAWADYIELLCLLDIDKQVNRAEVKDVIEEGKDLGEASSTGNQPRGAAQRDDLQATRVDDYFRQLEFRAGSYSDSYPFKLSARGETLRLKTAGRSNHYLYLFLLLSSNLQYFDKYEKRLTRAFELLSHAAMKEMLPRKAQIHLFGSSNPRMKKYPGNKYTKITALAKDLNTTLKIDEKTFSKTDVGDAGLDIVGWVPSKDTNSHVLTYFAQCACTEDWITKQHSSSYDAWNPIIELHTHPMNLAFIPYCFRSSNGDWKNKTQIHNSVLFDRLRLVRVLAEKRRLVASEIPKDILKNLLTAQAMVQ
ncbi:MAG: hypothetical protein ACJ71W_14985 [Terriglobales bacterium]